MTTMISYAITAVANWWNGPAPAPVYEADTELDIYDECPIAAFYYDKDMYLANDRYAEYIDSQIADDDRQMTLDIIDDHMDNDDWGQFVPIVDIEYEK